MKIIDKDACSIRVDYDDDAKDFQRWVKKHFGDKHLMDQLTVYKDDGSYNSPSGRYLEIRRDDFYCAPADLVDVWNNI